uniref:Secreted protein n=1 Tax=Steinernema glaseri TaxID=37863 RepID=A0A1I7ZL85_9BILA
MLVIFSYSLWSRGCATGRSPGSLITSLCVDRDRSGGVATVRVTGQLWSFLTKHVSLSLSTSAFITCRFRTHNA